MKYCHKIVMFIFRNAYKVHLKKIFEDHEKSLPKISAMLFIYRVIYRKKLFYHKLHLSTLKKIS